MKNRFEVIGSAGKRYFIYDNKTQLDLMADAERYIEFQYKCDAKAVTVLLNDYENQIQKVKNLVESI